MTPRRYAVVAGGGTGGHALPALAVARALADRGHDRRAIELVGSRRGPEGDLLAGEGFEVTLLPGRGLSRRLSLAGLATNLEAVAGLASALGRSLMATARSRPRVVVSIGGYASFAPAAAAVVFRVPLVLVNIDAVPGLVHRVLGRLAAASAVAFPGTPLPRAVVTGTPVRREVQEVDRSPAAVAAARQALGLPPDRATVGVFGGSLGARRINQAVADLAGRWGDRTDVAVYHVTGQRGWEELGPAEADDGRPGLRYRRVPFERQMARLYQAADVVVCRAGATTAAELAVAGVPSVLVPLPGAPGDHQTANARALVRAGAAVMVPDDECDAGRLGEVLDELLADPARRESMGRAARGLGHPDAAARVAEVVDAHAR
ncbi:MAG TPA: UDP-N-acetylglucosamine--N-acetylmuramyl-(pentapeptide) pyrophosphoryl-undecaprenol N-acetylglucosamine transferase [Acidimicrobiales bacterium]|nr:UDP-N-acetylglucosamine--N-acetylmuramyl-(pentapeptide) pyrophosphoryl-undecaprenol N-acetylglucosamine transferase [Acidimicrobiales bacterium]